MTDRPRVRVYLAYWRTKRGLTQQELADRVKCQQATIARIETGRQATLRLELLGRLATALQVEPYQLLRQPPARASTA